MQSEEIRKRFLEFFKERSHEIIPSASLVPENDPSVLFTTAGMQPLVPYLLGETHPKGQRLANVQKCVRTQDIEEVGDKTHDTFFEMMGNWSLGDREAEDGIGEHGYWKEEAITWSFQFLTDDKVGLGLDKDRLYITCFEGNKDVPRDTESAQIWQDLGIPEERIFFLGEEDNWWSPGENGPCGPDTEMFYDITDEGISISSLDDFKKADENQQIIEVWNDVFMQYEKADGTVVGQLAQKNVDTGAGLERLAMVLQKTDTVFETDLFAPIMEVIEENTSVDNTRAKRIVADHIRTAVFILSDKVTPSNSGRGYVLRRIIRRSVQYADTLELEVKSLDTIIETAIKKYESIYPEIRKNETEIKKTFKKEVGKFRKTLKRGLREFEKLDGDISGQEAFDLYQSYGFPIEMTEELANARGVSVDREGFESAMKEHKEKSRRGGEKKFKGGLADHSDISVQYHTATHLLHQALKDILGDHVSQEGSNITPDRLRFDFSHKEALTDGEIEQIEKIVNEKIQAGLDVWWEEMPVDKAKESGALYLENANYPDVVKVYHIGNPDGEVYSKEICGGPHVTNTSELSGTFKIIKETSSSAGVRRIKAVLEEA